MPTLRRANLSDLNFLVWIDREDEGVSSSQLIGRSDADLERHRQKIREFIDDDDKVAFVLVDESSQERLGAVLGRFRDRLKESFESWSVFHEIDAKHFTGDGRFCEVFQLWVHRDYRRRGLATRLKKKLEEESLARGIGTMYTHTEEENAHVIALNLKLGYFEVRRGPMWDEIPRVSLIKHLESDRPESRRSASQ